MKIPTLFLFLALVYPVYAADSELPAYYNDLEQLLLHRMNFSADPCEDFYTYACGNSDAYEDIQFSEIKRIFESGLNDLLHSTRLDHLKSSTAVSKVVKLYESCVKANVTESSMAANTKEKVNVFMKKFDFPTDFFFNADAEVKINRKKFSDILKDVHDNFSVQPFFQITSVKDKTYAVKNPNPTSFGYFQITPISETFNLRIAGKSAYFCGSTKLLNKFTQSVRTVATTMGLTATDDKIEETAKQLMDFEFKLLGISCSDNHTTPSDDLLIGDITDLTYEEFHLDLNNLLRNIIATGVGNNPFDYNNLTVYVFKSPWMTELNKTTDADLLRYMVFKIIVTNVKEVDCFTCLTPMDVAMSRIYTESKYATPAERKSVQSKIETIIKGIKKHMKAMVLSMPWIKKDKRAYNALVKKFDKMRYEVAIEASMLNNTWLDKYYKQIEFNDDDTFFDMNSKVLKFEMYTKVRSVLYEQVDFEDNLLITNAKFQPTLNKFVLNDGFLTAPNYHKKYLDSFIWGSVGFLCGHEMGHSVDSERITRNASGYNENFVSNATEQELEKMTSCVVEEYDKIQVLPDNYTPNRVNGQQTLTENLADATGLEALYRAFKDFKKKNPKEKRLRHPKLRGLTRDQIFFLGSVQFYCEKQADSFVEYLVSNDVHSPNKARAEGTLQNVPAMGRAFKCPVGSKYRPAKHCNVWTH